jgi:hypothetical protein
MSTFVPLLVTLLGVGIGAYVLVLSVRRRLWYPGHPVTRAGQARPRRAGPADLDPNEAARLAGSWG